MRLVLRGQVLIDLDGEEVKGDGTNTYGKWADDKVRPRIKHVPKKRVPKGRRCGRTKESLRPSDFQVFINQCTKETGHGPPHIFETKG